MAVPCEISGVDTKRQDYLKRALRLIGTLPKAVVISLSRSRSLIASIAMAMTAR